MKKGTQESTEYLAVIMMGMAGSWARKSSEDDAIRSVAAIARTDLGKVFKLPEEIRICVVEVSGLDTVYWNESHFFTRNGREPVTLERPVKLVDYNYKTGAYSDPTRRVTKSKLIKRKK